MNTLEHWNDIALNKTKILLAVSSLENLKNILHHDSLAYKVVSDTLKEITQLSS